LKIENSKLKIKSMELKEYLQIIKKYLNLFIAVTLFTIAGVFAYFVFSSESWSASLTLNITRAGAQETLDYKFDDFYRLQADEKFAETVVEWLKSPRMAVDIYEKAGIDASGFSIRQLKKSVTAEKMSSQIVAVSFSSPKKETSRKISDAVSGIIAENTRTLNKDQNEKVWFEVVAQDPVIVKDGYSAFWVFLASLAMGIFLGFWVVLVRFYLE